MDKLPTTAERPDFLRCIRGRFARCAIGKTCSVGVIFPNRRGGSIGELQRLDRSL